MKVKVEALDTYEKYNVTDSELGRIPKKGEQFDVTQERLNVLMGNNANGRVYVKILEPEVKEQKTVLPKKNITKRKK